MADSCEVTVCTVCPSIYEISPTKAKRKQAWVAQGMHSHFFWTMNQLAKCTPYFAKIEALRRPFTHSSITRRPRDSAAGTRLRLPFLTLIILLFIGWWLSPLKKRYDICYVAHWNSLSTRFTVTQNLSRPVSLV